MTINWKSTIEQLGAFINATPSALYRELAIGVQTRVREIGRAYEQHFPEGWTRPSPRIESAEHKTWRLETMPAALRALDRIAALADGQPETEIGADFDEAKRVILARLEAAAVATKGTPIGRLVSSTRARSHQLPTEPKPFIEEYYVVKFAVIEGTQAALNAGQAEDLMTAAIEEAEALLSLERPARPAPQVDDEPELLLDAVGGP